MKYTTQIDINLPLDKVIELFDNPDNMKHWQPTLVSFEHMSGEAGQSGAKSKLIYQMGKRKVVMIETITKRNLPEEFTATYDANGVYNVQKNTFVALDDNTSRWESHTEFKFSGMMKVIAFFMGSKGFQKETMKFHQQFKDFAEKA